MLRFKGQTPPVRKLSRAASGAPVDRATRERGLAFRVDKVTRGGADEAVVEGGYYEGGLSASGNRYVVAREKGRWVVKSGKMLWIS